MDLIGPAAAFFTVIAGLVCFCVFIGGAALLLYLLSRLFRRSPVIPTSVQPVSTEDTIDTSDGVTEKELAAMRRIVAKQIADETDAQTRERMVRAAGFDIPEAS